MSIYEKFCSEIFGDDGSPLNFTLNYDKNFNFGYDVVDAIAEKKDWVELSQKKKWNRNQERGKVNEADMKYIKGKLAIMKDEGYSEDNSEILRLKASLEELNREQARVQAEQSASAAPADSSGALDASFSMELSGSAAEQAAAAVGSTVDIAL